MIVAVIAENILAGPHVWESPRRKVLSGQNVSDSPDCMIMVNSSDCRLRT